MSKQLEGRCLVHKDCDVAHTVPRVLQIADLRAENARLQELVEELREVAMQDGYCHLCVHWKETRRGFHALSCLLAATPEEERS